MNILFDSNNKKTTVQLIVEADGPQEIVSIATDPERINTVYDHQEYTIDGREMIEIPLPRSPKHLLIKLYNKRNGNLAEGKDSTFRLISKKEVPLKQWLRCLPNDKKLWEAIKFFGEFNERAGWLSAGDITEGGSIYGSDQGNYKIIYLDQIVDYNTHRTNKNTGQLEPNPYYGMVLSTPMRTSEDDGRIEIAKERYQNWTIPERNVFSGHEWSHVNKNVNSRDEFEADLNALVIHLAQGYSKYSALSACDDVFTKSPSDQNKRRWTVCKNFIMNWENWAKKHCKY